MNRYEMMVGLTVKNDQVYNDYRQAMKPILAEYEGGFRFDFKVSETLVPVSKNSINRVFAIFFKNEQMMNDFFSNPRYLEVKKEYFEKSVVDTTIISQYEIEI